MGVLQVCLQVQLAHGPKVGPARLAFQRHTRAVSSEVHLASYHLLKLQYSAWADQAEYRPGMIYPVDWYVRVPRGLSRWNAERVVIALLVRRRQHTCGGGSRRGGPERIRWGPAPPAGGARRRREATRRPRDLKPPPCPQVLLGPRPPESRGPLPTSRPGRRRPRARARPRGPAAPGTLPPAAMADGTQAVEATAALLRYFAGEMALFAARMQAAIVQFGENGTLPALDAPLPAVVTGHRRGRKKSSKDKEKRKPSAYNLFVKHKMEEYKAEGKPLDVVEGKPTSAPSPPWAHTGVG